MSKIAKAYGTTVDAIREANPQTQDRSQADQVNVGENLTIPMLSPYQWSETSELEGFSISSGLGHVAEFNNPDNGTVFQTVGFEIIQVQATIQSGAGDTEALSAIRIDSDAPHPMRGNSIFTEVTSTVYGPDVDVSASIIYGRGVINIPLGDATYDFLSLFSEGSISTDFTIGIPEVIDFVYSNETSSDGTASYEFNAGGVGKGVNPLPSANRVYTARGQIVSHTQPTKQDTLDAINQTQSLVKRHEINMQNYYEQHK